jgi:hypothetical protein
LNAVTLNWTKDEVGSNSALRLFLTLASTSALPVPQEIAGPTAAAVPKVRDRLSGC